MPPTPIMSNTLDLSAVSGVDDPLIAQLRKQGRATTLDLSTGYASYVPQRPGAYLRLSKEDINEEQRERKKETNRKTAIERQMEDVEAKRKSLEWGPFAKLYEDPDSSACKKRKVTRPGAPMPDERTALLAPDTPAILVTHRTTHGTDEKPLILEEAKASAEAARLRYFIGPVVGDQAAASGGSQQLG